MTITVEPDTRGTDALGGALDDNVAPLRALIFDDLIIEMGGLFLAEPIDLSFDDEPWRELPTIEDLQHLWLSSTPIQQMITAVAIRVHGDGGDLPRYMAQQWQLAELELAWKKEAEHAEETGAGTVDGGGSAEAAGVASAAADGGGGDLPGGSEDGDAVGGGEEAAQPENTRRPSKVPRGRGSRKA